MKILLVNNHYYPHIKGGAEISVQLLAESLQNLGEQVTVITTAEENESGVINDVKVRYLRAPNLYWVSTAKEQPLYKKPLWHLIDVYNLFVLKKIEQIIAEERPDIVHTHNLAGLSVSVWKGALNKSIPVVHTLRDHHLLCRKSSMFRKGQNCRRQCLTCRIYSLPKKLLSGKLQGVVGVSQYILDRHLSSGYFEDVSIKRVIRNAVPEVATAESRMNDDGIFRLGLVGSLCEGKGTEYALQRFAAMNLEKAHLLVFGRGVTRESEEYLKSKYSSEKIHFLGFMEQEKIYRMIDVTLFPSLWNEALPRTIIESFNYGIPVIATDRGPARELIAEGVTGYLYDPDREGELEGRIQLIIQDKKITSSFKLACIKEAEKYRSSVIARDYLNIYRQVVR
ncbi:MAG: glycosyltransferase family 4 protein [Candidatus Zixiibacteriota bacterium]